MRTTAGRFALRSGVLLFSFLIAISLHAQAGGGSVSGTVTDASGKAVPGARVSVKNAVTGQSTETQADSSGHYEARDLAPGDYEVSAAAEGFGTTLAKATVSTGGRQTVNLTLGPALSLEGLGFSPEQTRGSAADQARLDKRSHMLKLHQRFGLLAAVSLGVTAATGGLAGGKDISSSGRDLHAALGLASVTLYSISAYYALAAPKIEGTYTRGNIRLHKALAWVHGAGMILTPILGDLAYQQRHRGERVHGIASAHGAVAVTTLVAYGAAILTEVFK
jgi:hypothetical protein